MPETVGCFKMPFMLHRKRSAAMKLIYFPLLLGLFFSP